MKKLATTLLFSVAMATLVLAEGGSPTVEKRKNISKTFALSGKDKVSIQNQYGEVVVNLWDKPEVKVEINIIGYGKNDEQAEKYVESVTIIDAKTDGVVSLKTEIEREGSSWWNGGGWSFSWGSSDSKDRKGVEINYQVFMPKGNALMVKNSYGRTRVPEFSAPLSVVSSYGSFESDKLLNTLNDIKVSYGKAMIGIMQAGDLKFAYSSLELEKAVNLRLNNKHGSMKVGDVESFEADLSYSSGKIGTLREVANVDVSYGGIDIKDVEKTTKDIRVKSAYSSVKFPVNEDNSFDFEVTTSFGDFSYPSSKTTLSTNPDDDDRHGYKTTKTYRGHMGKGNTPTRVYIKSSYGGVKVLDRN